MSNNQSSNPSHPAGDLDLQKVMEFLPHRYPFLLLDRIVSYELDKELVAYKNVSMNEPFFQGHFPGLPIMPGVLIVEAMAQSGGLLIGYSDFIKNGKNDNIFLFTGMDNIRIRNSVLPGDRLDLHVFNLRRRLHIVKMDGVATVDGKVAVEGKMTAAVMPRSEL